MRSGLTLVVLCIAGVTATFYGDPTKQEVELFEWTSGIRLPYCIDVALPDVAALFKKAFAVYITKYCASNRTHCNIKEKLLFGPQHVVFLEGYPRREQDSLNLRFMVLYPHNVMTIMKSWHGRPLLTRDVLAAALAKYRNDFARDHQWLLLSVERFPRYDPTTEFMNIAIIPIILFSLPLMVFLAYWTSMLRPNMSTESFMVSGASGGKNYAYRRTLEIIAEQNAEIEREKKMAITRHILVTPPREVVGSGVGMLLDVAKLSIETAHLPSDGFRKKTPKVPKEKLSASQPQINIEPGSGTPSINTDLEAGTGPAGGLHVPLQDVPEHDVLEIEEEDEYDDEAPPSSPHLTLLHPQHPHYARANRGFRRMSSVDEIVQKRRSSRTRLSTSTASSSGGRRQWKSGSLMLFGAARK